MASATHALHAAQTKQAPSWRFVGTGLVRLLPALLAAAVFCAPHQAHAQAVLAASSPNEPVNAPRSAVPATVPARDASSVAPSNAPSVAPSNAPSVTPSNAPSVAPSDASSVTPSNAPGKPTWTHRGVLSTAVWGGRGLVNVASAYPLTRGAFTLSVRADYLRARNLFSPGDVDSEATQSIHVAYSPVQGLEIALGQESLTNSYHNLVPRNLQLQGNPGLWVKYGSHVRGPLALAALVNVTIPTVQGNARNFFKGTTVTATGLLSLQPIERLEILANVGFHYDRSRAVFSGETPDLVQRFVFNINDSQSVRWGVGATGRISVNNVIDLLPFAEVTGDIGVSRAVNAKNTPMRATLGLRGYPTRNRAVEVVLGSDVRISGAPHAGSVFAGVAPWRAFAQVTVHLGEGPRCSDVAAAQTKPQGQTFRIRGTAVDADTGLPVAGASLHLAGDEALLLFGVDEQTGQFVSAPQPVGPGNLHLVARAPGYQSTTLDLPRSLDGRDVETRLSLQAEAHGSKLALLKGSIKDAESGRAIVGAEVQVVALKRTLRSNRAGAFAALLKPGRYSVVVRAPGYEPQRKVLRLEAGESTVLNIDASPLTP